MTIPLKLQFHLYIFSLRTALLYLRALMTSPNLVLLINTMAAPICLTGCLMTAMFLMAPMVPFSHLTSKKIAFCTFTTKICAAFYRWFMRRLLKLKAVLPASVSPLQSMCSLMLNQIPIICVSALLVSHPVHRMVYSMSLCVNTVSDEVNVRLNSIKIVLIFVDSPIMLSFPHFYLADDSLRTAVDGISPPEKEKHQLFIDVQPVSIRKFRPKLRKRDYRIFMYIHRRTNAS